ncbi:hypothetical protein HN011_006375 [Eciton burchellii]|nr:hypothetical protein HN011_006375 [Eciton burchellii]
MAREKSILLGKPCLGTKCRLKWRPPWGRKSKLNRSRTICLVELSSTEVVKWLVVLTCTLKRPLCRQTTNTTDTTADFTYAVRQTAFDDSISLNIGAFDCVKCMLMHIDLLDSQSSSDFLLTIMSIP